MKIQQITSTIEYFKYGDTEMDHLRRQDPILGTVIDSLGKVDRKLTLNVFEALIECIVGQQVSTKAAATINQRLRMLCGTLDPASILHADIQEIQHCGMTLKKAEYIRQAAKAIDQGDINIKSFYTMEDKRIIQQLSALRGVGRWTAEMILLHSLQRPNVFSENDLVIRRSLMLLHDLTSLSKKDFAYYRQLYSPYGSVAMIYLWKYAVMPR